VIDVTCLVLIDCFFICWYASHMGIYGNKLYF
jgi:hypothetical protein